MSIAQLGTQARILANQGYPADGSKVLPRRLERVCRLFAAEEMTAVAIAISTRVSHDTLARVRKQPLVAARIRFLREQLRASAYDAEPLVDKRNRVVAAAKLARVLHETLERNDYQDTIAVTKQGQEIKAHDRWRVQHYLDALAAVHRMVEGPSSTSTTSTTVNVGISMEDAAIRVQALLSRLPDAIEAESQLVEGVSPSEGGGEG